MAIVVRLSTVPMAYVSIHHLGLIVLVAILLALLKSETKLVSTTTPNSCVGYIQVELEAIEAESSIAAITDTITECRNKQEELMKKKDTTDPTEYTKMLKELKEQEETANGRLARYKKTTGKLSMMEKKQTALNERMEELVREDIYKRVAFWQNCLNYILYVIVVSNIFITGLGMGEAAMEDGASAPNAAKNTTVVSNTK